MPEERKTAAEEIREALATKFRAQILELIDPELVRRHIGEVITKEVENLFRSYSFTSELEHEVKNALEKEFSSALSSTLADPSTQQRIKKAVERAVQKGIDEAAAKISERVESTLTSSRY